MAARARQNVSKQCFNLNKIIGLIIFLFNTMYVSLPIFRPAGV